MRAPVGSEGGVRLGGLPPGTVSGFGTGAPQGQRQGWSGSEHTDALALDSVQHATYNTQRAVRNMQHTTRSMAHATRRSASCREHDDVHAHARHDPRRVHSQVLGVVATTSSATRRKRESVLGACGSARGMRLSGCLWCRVPQGFSGRAARHRCARAHAQRPAGAPSAGLTPRGGVCVSCGGALAPSLRRPRGDWWALACSSAGAAASRAVRRPIDGSHRRGRPERKGQGRTSAALRRANAAALGGSGRCSEYYGGRVLARIGH